MLLFCWISLSHNLYNNSLYKIYCNYFSRNISSNDDYLEIYQVNEWDDVYSMLWWKWIYNNILYSDLDEMDDIGWYDEVVMVLYGDVWWNVCDDAWGYEYELGAEAP